MANKDGSGKDKKIFRVRLCVPVYVDVEVQAATAREALAKAVQDLDAVGAAVLEGDATWQEQFGHALVTEATSDLPIVYRAQEVARIAGVESDED